MSTVTPSSPTGLMAPVLVRFQLGLFREVVRVPASNLSYRHAKRLAVEVIERKVITTSRRGFVSECCATNQENAEGIVH